MAMKIEKRCLKESGSTASLRNLLKYKLYSVAKVLLRTENMTSLEKDANFSEIMFFGFNQTIFLASL